MTTFDLVKDNKEFLEERQFIHNQLTRRSAVMRYWLVAIAVLLISPVFVYAMLALTNAALKAAMLLLSILMVSNITARAFYRVADKYYETHFRG